ncbi:MAG: hypothetical protein ACYT04_47490 [Nostoc sp.]
MTERLLVGVVGHSNAGKSSTWKDLFGTDVQTSHHGNERRLYLPRNKQELANSSGSYWYLLTICSNPSTLKNTPS